MWNINPEVLPIALQELLDRWVEKKESFRSGFNYGWPAKLVETRFKLDGVKYSITPDMIGLKQGDCWDEGLMEYLQYDLGEDLKEIGATDICHIGFID